MTNNHAAEAFPLRWPVGWVRSRRTSRSQFKGRSLYGAREFLEHELRLLGATSVVLSTNIPLRLDGLPYSNSREPSDHGAAIYFRLKNEPRVLACDRWDRVADNVTAIAKHVEAIRGQLRWGVGSLEQAFGGYRALAAMDAKKPWHVVLGVSPSAPWPTVEEARIAKLQVQHPDKGGSSVAAAEINAAFDEAKQARGAA